MKYSKGLSQVVTTVLLILLTIVAVGVIWTAINKFVGNRLEGAGSCYDVLDEIQINNDWTCYNASSNQTLISINRGDVNITSILVGVSFETNSTVFRITNEETSIEDVSYYNEVGSGVALVSLPTKEGGKTYVLNNVFEIPRDITISAQAGEKQCGVSDIVENVYAC